MQGASLAFLKMPSQHDVVRTTMSIYFLDETHHPLGFTLKFCWIFHQNPPSFPGILRCPSHVAHTCRQILSLHASLESLSLCLCVCVTSTNQPSPTLKKSPQWSLNKTSQSEAGDEVNSAQRASCKVSFLAIGPMPFCSTPCCTASSSARLYTWTFATTCE